MAPRFSHVVQRIIMRPTAVEFLVHMSLCAAVSAVNSLSEDGLVDRSPAEAKALEDVDSRRGTPMSKSEQGSLGKRQPVRHPRTEHTSITGGRLDLQWRQLQNVEYLTDGGNSWIHTAVFNGKPVVVKTLKPECQDVALAINEIEAELGKIYSLHLSMGSIYDNARLTPVFPSQRCPCSSESSKCSALDWGWLNEQRCALYGS